jgi:hypothetical protein
MSRTDNAYAGRVFASYETLTTLMMVAAMLTSGATADRFGIRLVAALGGAVVTLSGIMWFALRRGENLGGEVSGRAGGLSVRGAGIPRAAGEGHEE